MKLHKLGKLLFRRILRTTLLARLKYRNTTVPQVLDPNAQQQFICPIPGCFKVFTSQTNLNFHTYRVHLGIDTNVCSKSRW